MNPRGNPVGDAGKTLAASPVSIRTLTTEEKEKVTNKK